MTKDENMYYYDTCIELQLNMSDNPKVVSEEDEKQDNEGLTGLLQEKILDYDKPVYDNYLHSFELEEITDQMDIDHDGTSSKCEDKLKVDSSLKYASSLYYKSSWEDFDCFDGSVVPAIDNSDYVEP